jgi:hypothetical protein
METIMTFNVTPAMKTLFLTLWNDAGNWSGTPLMDDNSKSASGVLLNLKKVGLVTTFTDEGQVWVDFTDAGKEYAATLTEEETIPSEENHTQEETVVDNFRAIPATIGEAAEIAILEGKDNKMVLQMILWAFPEAKTSMNSVRWYRAKIKKEGKI